MTQPFGTTRHVHFEPPQDQICGDGNSPFPRVATFGEVDGRHPRLPLVMRREHYREAQTTGTHLHEDFLALYLVRGGKGLHRINGRPYGLARGDIYLMPAGANHEYADYRALVIDALYFAPDLLRDEELSALRSMPGFWGLFAGQGNMDRRLHLSPTQYDHVRHIWRELEHEWMTGNTGADLLLRAGVFRLLTHLARILAKERSSGGVTGETAATRNAATPARPAPTGSGVANHGTTRPRENQGESKTTLVADALKICEAEFASPLTVPALAARLFVSPGHLTDLFRAEIGHTPAAYIRTMRLEKARELLRNSQLTTAQVASRCGFADAAHLARAFRGAYGMAPLQYRKGHGL